MKTHFIHKDSISLAKLLETIKQCTSNMAMRTISEYLETIVKDHADLPMSFSEVEDLINNLELKESRSLQNSLARIDQEDLEEEVCISALDLESDQVQELKRQLEERENNFIKQSKVQEELVVHYQKNYEDLLEVNKKLRKEVSDYKANESSIDLESIEMQLVELRNWNQQLREKIGKQEEDHRVEMRAKDKELSNAEKEKAQLRLELRDAQKSNKNFKGFSSLCEELSSCMLRVDSINEKAESIAQGCVIKTVQCKKRLQTFNSSFLDVTNHWKQSFIRLEQKCKSQYDLLIMYKYLLSRYSERNKQNRIRQIAQGPLIPRMHLERGNRILVYTWVTWLAGVLFAVMIYEVVSKQHSLAVPI